MARHERSAGFIIYVSSPGQPQSVDFLLLDYGKHWDFPKGHIHKGEDELAAAFRELHEETGIGDARVVPGFRHEIVYFFRDRRHGLIRKAVVFFLAQVATREVTLSDEHVGFAFLPFEQAVKRVTFANARQVLRAAQQHLATPAEPATPTQ